MMFTLGDFLVLGVVVILIFIFRHLDRNNRSLEKVKRFADRIQQELALIAEEKSRQLKEISIGVDVHQQSARKAIERLESSAEDLNARSAYIDEIQERINQYDLALKQLVEMTNRAEHNIKGIQKESAYVDTVGRRIKDSQKRIEELEKAIPTVLQQFREQNAGQLTATSTAVLEESRKLAQALESRTKESSEQVNALLLQLSTESRSLQEDMARNRQQISTELQELYEGYQNELKLSEDGFRARMNEVADKARKFELKAFDDLQKELFALRSGSEQALREEIANQEQVLSERISSQEQNLNEKISSQGQALSEKISSQGEVLSEKISNQEQVLSERISSQEQILRKEISEHDQDLRSLLVNARDEAESSIYRLEDELRKNLEDAREQGSALADRLLTQIRENLDAQTRELGSGIDEQLELFRTRAEESRSHIDSGFMSLQTQLENWTQKSERYGQELEGRFSELREKSLQLEEEQAGRLRVLEEEISRTENEAKNRFSALREESQQLLAESGRSIAAEIGESSARGLQEIENAARHLSASLEQLRAESLEKLAMLQNEIEGKQTDLESRLGGISEQNTALIMRAGEEFKGNAQSVLAEAREQAEGLKSSLMQQLDEQRTVLGQRLDEGTAEIVRIQGIHEENRRRLAELDASLQNSISGLREEIRKGHEELGTRLEGGTLELEQKVLGDLEKRLGDYEGSITYRLSRLEHVGTEIEALDQRIHESMELMKGRIEEDVSDLGTRLRSEREEDLRQARLELDALQKSISAHQGELEDLRSQSHASMSEQLKVLEQQFFADLRQRGQNLDARLENWTEEYDSSLDRIRQEGEAQRIALEKKHVEDFAARMETLRQGMGGRIDELQEEVREREGLIRDDLSVLSERLNGARDQVDRQLEEIERQSRNTIETRQREIQEMLSARLQDIERQLDGSIKGLNTLIDEQGSEIRSLHDAVRSDVTLWQNQILQRMKSSESDVEEQISQFRVRVDEILVSLRSEYENERDGLLSQGEHAREELYAGIQDASVQLAGLRNELTEKSEEALERFNLDYQSFAKDISLKTRTMNQEMEDSMREFRGFVSGTRDEFEGTQRRLMDRLNEELRVLEVNIREIDKKQKAFLQQTRLFERADSLKKSLTDDIAQLKAELDRSQSERKQMAEMETQFVKIRKLGDEVNEKMIRFTQEQRRLEGIEDNYKKLMSLSSTVDSQLEKLSAKHDNLQQMQLAIRNLDELQKELDQRYERISKRKEVIDTTLEGVDRNFHQLTDLESRLSSLGDDISGLRATMDEARARLDSLAQNKKESDMAMRNLQQLNKMMEETQQKMNELQKAREWLARTETRLEEVAQQADQRIEMLGSIASQSRSPAADENRPAPSVSVRDMVIKLKHQGWKIEDIAKSCKISRGEVELILEMAHR